MTAVSLWVLRAHGLMRRRCTSDEFTHCQRELQGSGRNSRARVRLGVGMRVFRTYARVYAADADAVLETLAAVSGEPVGVRFSMPQERLELGAVGDVLVVAGDEEALAPYRDTSATLVVDGLDECLARLRKAGARIVQDVQDVPTGRNLTAVLPGGAQIEYVEWDDAQWDRVGGRPE